MDSFLREAQITELSYCPLQQDGRASLAIETLSQTGCFLVRSCVPNRLRRTVNASLLALFSLPQQEKLRYLADKSRNALDSGFSPYGVARALDTGIPNLLETWDLGDPLNKWPSPLQEQYDCLETFEA